MKLRDPLLRAYTVVARQRSSAAAGLALELFHQDALRGAQMHW